MPSLDPKASSRRFSVDGRFDSQLAWLERVAVLAFNDHPPSHSQLVRRAVGLLVEHAMVMIEAGRLVGLSGPSAQTAEAERAALADYSRIVPADLPRTMVDAQGQLQGWFASLAAPPVTAIATARSE
jgi:hypothetical protein